MLLPLLSQLPTARNVLWVLPIQPACQSGSRRFRVVVRSGVSRLRPSTRTVLLRLVRLTPWLASSQVGKMLLGL